MLSVLTLNVTYEPYMLIAVITNVVMLSGVARLQNLIIQNETVFK